MGLWPLAIVGFIVFMILYGWILGEAENRRVPIFILLGSSLVFFVFMGIISQWYLVIGSVAGGILGTFLLYIFSPDNHHQEKRFKKALYIDYCWKCGHKIDRREAELCPKCKKHYICPKCHMCLCDKKDHQESIEE